MPEEELTLSDIAEDLRDISLRDKISYLKRLEIRDTMILFANEHHRNTSGFPMRWDTFGHMVELYMEGALHKDIVIMAGTQIGKTDWLIIYVLAAAYCGLNVFFVLPKDDMRDTYVSEKVLKPVKLSEFYMNILRDGTSKSRDLLHFGRGTIKFVGGKSEANFSSYSADIVVVDETDQMTVPKNIDIAIGRLNQSIHKYTRYISNPSTTKGFIYQAYLKTDQRVMKYPCKNCGKMQEIDFFNNVVELKRDDDGNVIDHILRDKDYYTGSPQDIRPICSEKGCGGEIDRFGGNGEWVPTAVSPIGTVGYKMPSFCSINVEFRDIYKQYVAALDSINKMEAFYIKHIAEPYATAGNKVSEGLLDRCTSDKNHIFIIRDDEAFSKDVIKEYPCIMGVDVSDSCWDISISHPEEGKNPDLHRLVYLGKKSPQDGLFFLHDLVDRYNVICTVIDLLPQTLEVMKFQNECKTTVWRLNFYNVDGRETEFKKDIGQVNVNHRELLDKSYAVYRNSSIIVPVNYEEIFSGNYVKEMTSLSRTSVVNNKGVWIGRWEGSRDNHHRFADAYRNLAREICFSNVLKGKDCVFIR